MSHPPRGEWIEIKKNFPAISRECGSHPPRGEWIEISMGYKLAGYDVSLTPRGVSGLK